MQILLYILIFLLGIGLLWLIANSLFLRPLSQKDKDVDSPLISILIPMRNEERNVKDLIHSIQELSYTNFECILLDDQSEDHTVPLALEAIGADTRFRLKFGNRLPENWNGKVYACHQLSQYAEGDYLFFIDADVRLETTTVERTLATMLREEAGMISGFPHYPVSSRLAQLLVTLQHFIVQIHLPIFIANTTNSPSFTAACGQFIAFDRQTYHTIGGHKAVQSSLLEDVHLGRLVKKSGQKMTLANVTSSVHCYMYDSLQEAIEGFTKNIFIGINKSKWTASLLILFYSACYILPIGGLIYACATGHWLYTAPYLLGVAQKAWVDSRTQTSSIYSLFMPLSALLLVYVLLRSMFKSIKGKAYTWKGRSYS